MTSADGNQRESRMEKAAWAAFKEKVDELRPKMGSFSAAWEEARRKYPELWHAWEDAGEQDKRRKARGAANPQHALPPHPIHSMPNHQDYLRDWA
jgi:hypothetical protein